MNIPVPQTTRRAQKSEGWRLKLLRAERYAAVALAEGGLKAKAELLYQKSSRWLMRANSLRERPDVT